MNKKKEVDDIMNVLEIPQVLFQEFSQKLGQGEEKKVDTDGLNYSVRELNPEAVGFSGAIGFCEDEDASLNGHSFTFALWEIVPRGEDDIVEPKPVLKITAGPESAGTWMHGMGSRIKEMCRADFSSYSINLRSLSSRLIPIILQRASEMAFVARYKEFWEKDYHPERDYTKSPK